MARSNDVRLHIPVVDFVQVRSNCLIIYSAPAELLPRRKNVQLPLNAYSGKVTNGAQKRIRRSIENLVQRSPTRRIYNEVTGKNQDFSLSFITLTVSDQNLIDHRLGYKMLKEFLRNMRRKGMEQYIWKAELQKRGQIHYHLTTNSFLNVSTIRRSWNKLQKNEGLLDEYALKHKHFDPNSIDVHSVYKVQNLPAYLGKYLSKKGEDEIKIKGKVWDCSKDLKTGLFNEIMDWDTAKNIKKDLADGIASEKKTDTCSIICWKPEFSKRVVTSLSDPIRHEYQKWINLIPLSALPPPRPLITSTC